MKNVLSLLLVRNRLLCIDMGNSYYSNNSSVCVYENLDTQQFDYRRRDTFMAEYFHTITIWEEVLRKNSRNLKLLYVWYMCVS